MKYLFAPVLLLLFACGNQQVEEIEKEVVTTEPAAVPPSQPTFDHQAIIVADLDRAVDFYLNLVGLPEIYDATEKDHIRWFDLGNGTSLHVIESETVADLKLHKSVHLSLTVGDLQQFIGKLEVAGHPYENWPGQADTTNLRPDGVSQIYFQDLDGYWIEVNDAQNFR